MTPNDRSQHIADLISGHYAGTLNPEEQAELDTALQDDAALKRVFDTLADRTTTLADLNLIHLFDPELTLLKFQKMYPRKRTFKIWHRLGTVAAIIALITFVIYFFNYRNNKFFKQVQNKEIGNDIGPGKPGATLTLASGKTIILSEALHGELAQETGVTISQTAKGQLVYKVTAPQTEQGKFNTLSTAKGETYMVVLPDKSKVWLNTASSLKYPASFSHLKSRTVELIGEAYFEVSKDKIHPFIVKTAQQEVRVMGTHFNINSYPDEPVIKTTLLEGSVKIVGKAVEQTLKPGEQAANSGSTISINQVDTENIVDWKNNVFVFNGEDFKAAMRKIERWYGVTVIYDASVPENIEPGGWISRNNQLSAVLNLIASTGQVHFKIEGRRITVTK